MLYFMNTQCLVFAEKDTFYVLKRVKALIWDFRILLFKNQTTQYFHLEKMLSLKKKYATFISLFITLLSHNKNLYNCYLQRPVRCCFLPFASCTILSW